MRRYADLKTKTKVGLGVAAPLVLMGMVGVISLTSIDKITHTADWVDHTRKVLAESEAIVASAVDMETGMRGYLLAGREEFLDPYKTGAGDAYARISELQRTVSDNPGQVARLDKVEAVLRRWQTEVAETQIALRREIGDADTMNDMAKLVGEARGKTYFDRFRGQIGEFIAREQTLLDQRRATFEVGLSTGSADAAATREAMRWVTHTYAVIASANEVLAAAVDMETGMRGYLLAGDAAFLEPFDSGRTRFFDLASELRETVSDNPAQVELLLEIEATISGWIDAVVTPMIDLRREIGDSKTMDDMADLIGEARGKFFFDQFRELMADFAAEEEALMTQRQAANVSTVSWAFWTILACIGAGLAAGLLAAAVIGASIANPINAVSRAMRRLAEGDTSVDITGRERGDEVGQIAAATQVFKENAVRMRELADAEAEEQAVAAARQAAMAELQGGIRSVVAEAVRGEFSNRVPESFEDEDLKALAEEVNGLMGAVDQGVSETARVLRAIASGDLDDRMTGRFDGAFAELQTNLNETVERLSDLVSRISATTGKVRRNADSITASAGELSQRATQQASSLEETAATMEEMSASIKSNADNSATANSLAADATQRAESGGGIVQKAVGAMTEIEASAAKIADIISVIDGIAFQTNLLALNAAVEAARAGDAGKGFAVVASEVRALAQRSSEASSDIRELIETSAGQVSEGVKLVGETGDSLEGIVSSIAQVEASIRSIASASTQQASGVEEISAAISHMDQMTQQNSAMAEESASNARTLVDSAQTLQELIAFFKMAESAEAEADSRWRAAAAPEPERGERSEEAWSNF